MYLNVVQLAESFGVEEAVVHGWIRNEGLPAIEDRGRFLFDRAQVIEWAARRGLTAKAGFLAPTHAPSRSSRLAALLPVGGIWRDVPSAEVTNCLERIISKLPGVSGLVRSLLLQRLRAPDGITWAPVDRGWALPHLRSHVALGRDAGLVAMLLLRDTLSVLEPPADGMPITRLLFFIAPSPRAHLELLAELSSALSRGRLRELADRGASDEEILASLGGEGGGQKA